MDLLRGAMFSEDDGEAKERYQGLIPKRSHLCPERRRWHRAGKHGCATKSVLANLEPIEDSGSAVHEAAREESPLSDSVQ